MLLCTCSSLQDYVYFSTKLISQSPFAPWNIPPRPSTFCSNIDSLQALITAIVEPMSSSFFYFFFINIHPQVTSSEIIYMEKDIDWLWRVGAVDDGGWEVRDLGKPTLVPIQAWNLRTTEANGGNPSLGTEDWCSSWSNQAEWILPSFPLLFIQVPNILDEVHLRWGGPSGLLSLPIQMLISLGNTLRNKV